MKRIYLDNAATTPISPTVLKAMMPYLTTNFGNASSIYQEGQIASAAINNSKKIVAQFLNCQPNETTFTGSASESNNIVLFGIVKAFIQNNPKIKPHIITSVIEHPAILNTCKELEKQGVEVTYIPVNQKGIVDIKILEKSIKQNTVLVSIMYANNEIGTIQPIEQISQIIKKHKKDIYPLFHTDAVQATNYLNCDVTKLKVDLLTLSGHKIYGPKGIGALYVRTNTPIETFIFGGGQEKLRSGTENVAGIVGLGKAVEEISKNRKQVKKISNLRNQLLTEILKNIPNSRLNGSKDQRLPHNINFSYPGSINGKQLVLMLDQKGISVSTGSACHTKSPNPSHVLKSIGLTDELALNSLRITLSHNTTLKEIKYVSKTILASLI